MPQIPTGPDNADYPRDLVGYGRTPPDPRWPGGARLALQVVVNYEEGGENCVLHGDPASEAFLSEIIGARPWPGQRHMSMESIYEYGASTSRATGTSTTRRRTRAVRERTYHAPAGGLPAQTELHTGRAVLIEAYAVIPFEETHVMEHGLYVLEGKAVYRLNRDWVEVAAGDFMWLRAFCPQACYAGGPGPFRYLLYKDVNRHPRLGVPR